MAEPLPTFRYHPDPIGTGSIAPTDEECEACTTDKDSPRITR